MDADAIEFAKEKELLAEKLNQREHEENSTRSGSDDRSPYSRDYARVLYSSSFRRLQGKMQLLGIDETRFTRNRLTHSLEVAQIARGLATSLELRETIVSETCALIHDIGNPPFGHAGEDVLNELVKDVGGYEGNAQAFRVMRSLEKKHPRCSGLNLTDRTLWGTVKYFHKRENEKTKKFLYDDDYEYMNSVLISKEIHDSKSIDAQIMDLADEIAYAAHDLEDALSSNLLVIGELIHEFSIDDRFKCALKKIKEIVKDVQIKAGESNTLNTSEEYSIVFKKELTSRIVNELVQDIGLVTNNGIRELGYKTLSTLALGLKKLVFKVVLRKRHIQEYEIRGEKIIRGLFEVYSDKKFNGDFKLLPPELRGQKADRHRVVCDYISGMMDPFAVQEYIKYFGKSKSDSLFE